MYIGEKMKYYLVCFYILLVSSSAMYCAWASDTPELVPVAGPDAEAMLQPDMASAATLYTRLMWAVYCRTGEHNVRKSKTAYDALVDEFCIDPLEVGEKGEKENRENAPKANTTKKIDGKGSSFIYTQRAALRLNPLQDIRGAEMDCRKAIALNPQSVPATWLLAKILTKRFLASPRPRQSVQEEMLAVLKRVVELDSDHIGAHSYLGSIARELGQRELASASFKALTRIMPFEWEYHMELGDLYKEQNQIQDAILSYERVVTILPAHTAARNHLGQLYLQVGDAMKAVNTFRTILEAFDSGEAQTQRNRTTVERAGAQIEAHYGIGLAYQELNNFEKAEFHLMKAAQFWQERAKHPRNAAARAEFIKRLQEVRYALGQVYLRFNAPKQATEIFADVLATDEQNIAAMIRLGIAYQMLDDVEQAETYLRKAIALSPDEVPYAYNALGYLYAEQGIKLDEAAVLVQRALQTMPTSGAYLDSLGLIYFKQGKIDAAITTLEKALHYMPQTPEILLHLGDAYLQKGLKQKAVLAFEQALQLAPDNRELREKLDAMKSQ